MSLPPKSSFGHNSNLQLHDDVDDGEEAECGEGEDGEDGAHAGGDEPVRGLEVGVRAAEGVVGSVRGSDSRAPSVRSRSRDRINPGYIR